MTTEERTRVTLRMPNNVVEHLEEAAAILGIPLNQFIINVAYEAALKAIERETTIQLSRRDRQYLMSLLDMEPREVK